ncbi:MAG: tetratricopeptide repeat protein [Synechococcaceae cyanobacterium SM2_3_2]|nr:tetratricopeptide repeat protein [Synechococcaceae cyanobacterium SM2_3_2]
MVELEPEDLNLRLLLAQLKMQSGDTAGSLEQYEQMVVDFPDNPRIEQELLNAKVRAGDFDGAIAMLQQQIAEDPESTDTRRDLAATYVQANQPEAALPIYDELIAADPTDYSYLLGKGMALSVMADDEANFEEAQDLFAQALRLAPPQQREQVEQITEFYSQLATANSVVSETPAPSPDPSSDLDSTSEPSADSSAD